MADFKKAKIKIIDPKSQANNPFQKGLIESIWSWTSDIIFKKPQKQKFKDKVKIPTKRDPNELRYFKFYEGEADPEEMYDYFRKLYKSIISSHNDGKHKECLGSIIEYQTESNSDMFFKFINLITEAQRDKIINQDGIIIKLSIKYTRNKSGIRKNHSLMLDL